MAKLTDYQIAKIELKNFTKEIITKFPNDKPFCRQEINWYAEYSCQNFKQLKNYESREVRMFEERLHNYACKLHPKD